MRKRFAMLVTSALLLAGLAAPAATAQPITQGGLVNVVVGDVTILENVNVGLALTVAAALCDVNVNVLAMQLRTGDTTCDATSGDAVVIQNAGNGNGNG